MDTELKLDINGNVDTDYYIKQAYQLRHEYNAALILKLTTKIKALFSFELPKIFTGRPTHH
ncbi:RSP_7527 family protein [Neptunomonas antarctica]|uniref:Uncharacterized protein n=1 Tax=Neptunomonas antarctica TaxID=619304 RepID=A0A1N7JUR4_9GAMM|nr:hypothetical protein SAMN05421760_10220 [Neptunomonas antarctica]